MAVLSLPLTFANSFWSQDYRKGLQVLYGKLEQGVAENDEIVAFLRARALAESNLANALINPLPINKSNNGFGADDGASLLMAFRGLQAESAAQGQAHNTISKELSTLVADPFDDWARAYKDRIKQNKATVIDNWLKSYEQAQADVAKLKSQYLAKVRRADEAEDDAKFAPNSGGPVDKYTSSPRMRPVDGHRTPPQRTASVSERIAQRLKEIQKKSALALASATSTDDPGASPESLDSDTPLPSIDKGKGKERDFGDIARANSPPPLSPLPPPKDVDAFGVHHQQPQQPPTPILLAGLAIPPAAVSQLLTRAAAELPLRAVRFPLLGEYQDAFTGEEFVSWLQDNVPGLGGSIDRAEEAAKDLTQRDGLLRRLGELGNLFEDSDDAWYQFRPKAFELGKTTVESNTATTALNQSDNILKKTGNFVSLVSKALNNNNSSGPNGEPAYVRARQEADEADKMYRIGVRRLDRHRLALEERIEETLKILQRWEGERLRAVKTVLLQYQGTLANLPKSLDTSIERQSTLIASFQPESDLTALIERYRTGPFRPAAHVYESVAHDEVDVVFGVDLRRWAEGGWWLGAFNGDSSVGVNDEKIPPVLSVMLRALEKAYGESGTSDVEKRKSWIYEVPLGGVHQLRESLNAVAGQALQGEGDAVGKYRFSEEEVGRWGMPVVAACVKLWMLEMNPPIGMWEGWEEFRKLYPTVGGRAVLAVGSGATAEGSEAGDVDGSGSSNDDKAKDEEEARLARVAGALIKLPRVHLLVLDAVVKHLRMLEERTKGQVEESEEVFYTKVALSMGRTILRPKVETELSIQDRHPTLLLIDLLKHYDTLLPPTIARKKRESERKIPIRKRTAPIDIRLSRSRISVGADVGQLLAAQQVAQNPSLAMGHARSGSVVAGNTAPTPATVPAPAPVSAGVVASPLPVSPDAYSTSVVMPPPPPPAVTRVSPAPPVVPPPPPPVLEKANTPPPPPPAAAPAPPAPAAVLATPPPPPPLDAGLQRPSFKEPPPEFDNLPPRPTFKEPPPELDDLPPRPAFADPPPEDDSTPRSGRASVSSSMGSPLPSPPPPPPVLATNVIPPTPQKRGSLGGAGSGTNSKVSSRSPSPQISQAVVDGDVVLGTGRASISRSGSAQAQQAGLAGAGVTRGPRLARAARGGGSAGGGSVQSLVQNLNRSSMSGATPVSPGSPKVGGGVTRLSGSPVRRPSSVVGRSGAAFSRRTMASDAEDDVVERK